MNRIAGLTRSLVAVIVICGTAWSAPAPGASNREWRRIEKLKGTESVRIEMRGRTGSATYVIASSQSPVEAKVSGPGRLRVLLRPEFPSANAPASAVPVTIELSETDSRNVVAYGVPSRSAHYAGTNGVPGEVVTAYFDIPRGAHGIRISSARRVGVKLYIGR